MKRKRMKREYREKLRKNERDRELDRKGIRSLDLFKEFSACLSTLEKGWRQGGLSSGGQILEMANSRQRRSNTTTMVMNQGPIRLWQNVWPIVSVYCSCLYVPVCLHDMCTLLCLLGQKVCFCWSFRRIKNFKNKKLLRLPVDP